jgi:hypothetical protein
MGAFSGINQGSGPPDIAKTSDESSGGFRVITELLLKVNAPITTNQETP